MNTRTDLQFPQRKSFLNDKLRTEHCGKGDGIRRYAATCPLNGEQSRDRRDAHDSTDYWTYTFHVRAFKFCEQDPFYSGHHVLALLRTELRINCWKPTADNKVAVALLITLSFHLLLGQLISR